MGRYVSGQHFLAHRALAPRILYLCPKGKFSTDPWVDGKASMCSNQKNIARKRVQERVEISGKLYFQKMSKKRLKSGKLKKIRPLLL